MEFKAKDIAALLKGVVEGDGEVMVNNVSKIEEGKPNTLAFLANPKYEHYIYTTAASVVLVNHDFSPVQQVPCTLIRVPSAYEAIASLLQMYDSMRSRCLLYTSIFLPILPPDNSYWPVLPGFCPDSLPVYLFC